MVVRALDLSKHEDATVGMDRAYKLGVTDHYNSDRPRSTRGILSAIRTNREQPKHISSAIRSSYIMGWKNAEAKRAARDQAAGRLVQEMGS